MSYYLRLDRPEHEHQLLAIIDTAAQGRRVHAAYRAREATAFPSLSAAREMIAYLNAANSDDLLFNHNVADPRNRTWGRALFMIQSLAYEPWVNTRDRTIVADHPSAEDRIIADATFSILTFENLRYRSVEKHPYLHNRSLLTQRSPWLVAPVAPWVADICDVGAFLTRKMDQGGFITKEGETFEDLVFFVRSQSYGYDLLMHSEDERDGDPVKVHQNGIGHVFALVPRSQVTLELDAVQASPVLRQDSNSPTMQRIAAQAKRFVILQDCTELGVQGFSHVRGANKIQRVRFRHTDSVTLAMSLMKWLLEIGTINPAKPFGELLTDHFSGNFDKQFQRRPLDD